jgi:hypothetical protein
VVGLGVAGIAATVVLCALAEVDAAGQLADNVEVDAAADLGLERRAVDEGLGGEEAGAQVAVGAHFFAQLEDALLRTDLAGAPFGTANGSEEDGVGGFCGFEGLVGQGLAGGIDGGLGSVSGWVGIGGIEGRRTPPRRWSWKLNLRSVCSWIVRRIWRALLENAGKHEE